MHRSAPDDIDVDSALIDSLQVSSAYPHPVSGIDMIETHISWVLLTGDYVYKIKKPLDLGFLDFSTLERRRFFCEEEIRLNKPWAPDIYIDVVPISLTNGGARIGDESQVVEYAVRMHSFDQAMRLDAQLDAGLLSVEDMRELGAALARRHGEAARIATDRRERSVRRAVELINENFASLEGEIEEPLLGELRAWTGQQLSCLAPYFQQRFDDGFFRECHGDLHLGNLVRLPDGITTFDCIEFNDDLRDIDVIADIAFLVMDLVARGELHLAAHFLNRYLEFSGDYEGMRVFNLYFTYRCLVRAKIAVIRRHERHDEQEREADRQEAARYCEMARKQIQQREPMLLVMTGLSGSGKTWVSSELMAAIPAIRVRSDIERKRLSGLSETADSGSGVATGIYTGQVTDETYRRLNVLAGILLDAGHNVILDAAFLHLVERTKARTVAEDKGAGFMLIQTLAEESLLRERIEARRSRHLDASEAGPEVLEYQLQHIEVLTQEELKVAICCSSADFDAAEIVSTIQKWRCR